MNQRRSGWATVLALTVSFLVGACGVAAPPATNVQRESAGGSIDMPIYASIAELAAASDVVVVGTVGKVVAEEIDRGASGEGRPIPYTLYEVNVEEALKGEPGGTVIVARSHPDQLPTEDVTKLQEGESVVLFLVRRSSQDWPSFKAFDQWYLTVSLDNGVFDFMDENVIRPRLPEAFADPTLRLTDVRQAITR